MTVKDTRYYPLLDAFRFLAAIAIVWLHVAGVPSLERSKVLGRFAVPFFTCVAVFLAFDTLRRHPDMSIGKYFTGRLLRIYLLFLAWSIFYAVVRSGSSVLVEHKGWLKITPREFLLDGVAIQLWFLPFIIVATTMAFTVAKFVRTVPAARLPMMAGAVILGCVVGLPPTPGWVRAAGYSPSLSYETLPAGAWGIALGLTLYRGPKSLTDPVAARPISVPQGSVSPIAAALGVAGFGTWLILALLYGRAPFLENVAGLCLFVLALSKVSSQRASAVAALGALSFGVYLAHALFVEGLQHLLPKIGVATSGFRDVVIWLLSVLGSCALVFLLKRAGRWTAWLAG